MGPALDYPLPPVRGLITAHTASGRPIHAVDLHRWIHYLCSAFDLQKLDVLAHGSVPECLGNLLAYSREFQLGLSLRTDAAAWPPDLAGLRREGLFDVFLCPGIEGGGRLDAWLDGCRSAGLPMRLQLQAPWTLSGEPEAHARQWADAGVRVLHLVVDDPFSPGAARGFGQEALGRANRLGAAAVAAGVEVTLRGVPPGLLDEGLRAGAGDWREFFGDVQQYHEASYAVAVDFFPRAPRIVRGLLLLLLTGQASQRTPVDKWLLHFLQVYATPLYPPVMLASKLWRTFAGGLEARTPPPPQAEGIFGAERGADFRRIFPSLPAPDTAAWEIPQTPRKRALDPIDQYRLDYAARQATLASEAAAWEQASPPSRTLSSTGWVAENAFSENMYGASKWYAAGSGEKLGTRLPWLEAPFMVSLVFGGGMAECIGFGIERHIRLLCPMIHTSHTLTLYVNAEGHFALLRDGRLVEPLRIAGRRTSPPRLPSGMHLRLAAWNIQDTLAATPIRVWEGGPPAAERREGTEFSVVIFCTRFARRLAAVLACVAHQRGIDMGKLEVIVAYVPGIDGTGDVLDSMRLAHPELRVLHAPFPAYHAKSKGFALNEALRMAAGKRIVLLDADTLVGPGMFAALEEAGREHVFIAPEGRAMLDRATTARILLGEIRPWEQWEELLASAPEFRDRTESKGVPIGFCQCFAATCLEKVRYPEYEHFQGADFEFGIAMRKAFGEEHRLPHPVLHLDHEGSQWYGAHRHF